MYRALRKSSDNAEAKLINEAIIDLARSRQDKCEILLLVAKDPKNLAGASELSLADNKIGILFHDSLITSDLRLTIADRTKAIIGFSGTQKTHKKYKESHDWLESTSTTLTFLLGSYASSLAKEGMSFETYLSQTIAKMRDTQNLEMPHIAQLLGVPKMLVDNLVLAQQENAADPPKSRLI